MKLTKTLGIIGLLASILVGLGEYLLHYSTNILEHSNNYDFFSFVNQRNLTWGHFLSIIGLPLYFGGYIHIYRMLKNGNPFLAKLVLALGFIAFAVGGVWIGSRSSIGNIVHLKSSLDYSIYEKLLNHYTNHMEILVEALRIVIALLSIFFVITILKGNTYYKKWMAIFNPITILITLVIIGKLIPNIGKHMLPILMNVTHFILFSISLTQLNQHLKSNQNA
ncbi:DUF6796 family protein [Tenacibaculum sp. M341]|uniref:DUF6796 family protein n=1 Tax=Tenacibaculum sp. M341 TaxID=2530339 RepID=UPI0010532C40|nr:DUF6796 family protein [Tenacibaculum sp. M341]TCI90127.1 hypothetical protein EYW44_14420 [Tenacibaculum sp. M341]